MYVTYISRKASVFPRSASKHVSPISFNHYFFTYMSEETNKVAVEVPAKFQSLVESIEKMSVLDLAELVKILEEKFGVSAAAPAMMMAAGSAAAAPVEEKTSFNVELTGVGENKINVIKAVRELTSLGLKEAKDIVDSAPKMLKENVSKEEAEEIKKKIETAGGSAVVK